MNKQFQRSQNIDLGEETENLLPQMKGGHQN